MGAIALGCALSVTTLVGDAHADTDTIVTVGVLEVEGRGGQSLRRLIIRGLDRRGYQALEVDENTDTTGVHLFVRGTVTQQSRRRWSVTLSLLDAEKEELDQKTWQRRARRSALRSAARRFWPELARDLVTVVEDAIADVDEEDDIDDEEEDEDEEDDDAEAIDETVDDAFDFGGLDDLESEIGDADTRPVLLSGAAHSSWATAPDQTPALAKARQSLDVVFARRLGPLRVVLGAHGEWDLAYPFAREQFDTPTTDAYEYKLDTRDAYAAIGKGGFELAVGRQIIAWGEADTLTQFDIVSPRDQREPGLTDIDGLRLPVLATRASYSSGRYRLDLIGAHEPRIGYRPPPLSPFSPLPALVPLPDMPFTYDHSPSSPSIDNQQLFGRFQLVGRSFDVTAYGAYVLDQFGVIEMPEGSLEIPTTHERYGLGGLALSAPLSKLLVSLEAAGIHNRRVNTITDVGLASSKLSGVIGVASASYASGGVLVSAEASAGHVVKKTEGTPILVDLALTPLEDPTATVRLHTTIFRDDIELRAFALATLGADWLARASVRARLRESLYGELGYIVYRPGDDIGPLSGQEGNDRLFLSLRYDFAIRAP